MEKIYDCVIIGGGQCGLAMASYLQCLCDAGEQFRFCVVDAHEEVGVGAWIDRWDSLSLLSPAAFSSLPDYTFADFGRDEARQGRRAPGPNQRPTRDQLLAYLRAYTRRLKGRGVQFRPSHRVTRMRRIDPPQPPPTSPPPRASTADIDQQQQLFEATEAAEAAAAAANKPASAATAEVPPTKQPNSTFVAQTSATFDFSAVGATAPIIPGVDESAGVGIDGKAGPVFHRLFELRCELLHGRSADDFQDDHSGAGEVDAFGHSIEGRGRVAAPADGVFDPFGRPAHRNDASGLNNNATGPAGGSSSSPSSPVTTVVIKARQVVLATGSFGMPFVPPCTSASLEQCGVPYLHSSQYRSFASSVAPLLRDRDPENNRYEGGRRPVVAVVGCGASGVQIAHDIAAHGAVAEPSSAASLRVPEVFLIGRDPGSLPRSVFGKDVYWWLYKSGLLTMDRDSFVGRKARLAQEQQGTSGDQLVGPMLKDACKAGVHHVAAHVVAADATGRLRLVSLLDQLLGQRGADPPLAGPATAERAPSPPLTPAYESSKDDQQLVLDDRDNPDLAARVAPASNEDHQGGQASGDSSRGRSSPSSTKIVSCGNGGWLRVDCVIWATGYVKGPQQWPFVRGMFAPTTASPATAAPVLGLAQESLQTKVFSPAKPYALQTTLSSQNRGDIGDSDDDDDDDEDEDDSWFEHDRGVGLLVPGLYFLGLPWMQRADSSLLHGVGPDARHLAYCIRALHREVCGRGKSGSYRELTLLK